MFRNNRSVKSFFSLLAFFSISFQGVMVRATDIVAEEDVISGSSVFVFRESRKRPQERAGSIGVGTARKRTYRERMATGNAPTEEKGRSGESTQLHWRKSGHARGTRN